MSPANSDHVGRVPSPRSDEKTGERPRPISPLNAEPDEATGLPGACSWRTVYTVVLGIFLLWAALLTWLTEAYK